MKLRQTALALLLILGGLAQINTGIRAADSGRSWLMAALPQTAGSLLAALLWAVAMLGLVAAGFGVRGVPPFSRRPRQIALAALAASALLLALFWGPLAGAVAVVDLVVLAAVLTAPRWAAPPRTAGRFARVLAAATLAYLAVILALRPWHIRWGATVAEHAERWSSDELVAEPAYQETRAITIRAPVAEVWPWLAQVGQDRAGFYSYDVLERLVGFDVQNVHRVVPEWQSRVPGDLVRAAPADYLGGALGPNFGWRVAAFEPNRELALTSPAFNWTFLVRPVDERTTRVLVRLRMPATPDAANFGATIADFLGVGMAHFIMERKMLLTLKRLAEAGAPTRPPPADTPR
jgi:hypothetical protein